MLLSFSGTRRVMIACVLVVVVGCGATEGSDATKTAAPPGSDPSTSTPPSTSANDDPAAPAPTTPPVVEPTPAAPSGPASLKDNRDRLIDTLATQKKTTRCALWSTLTPTQRGVFLTITDLLGKRSFLTNGPATGGPRQGTDLDMALDHVTKIYDVRDSYGSNGGAGNRIWISADTQLIGAMRAFDSGLPEWAKSTDWGGPHEPFDATSETVTGQPRGQSQFWSNDAASKPLERPGVEGINDPHIVEIDIDYNILHDSNPEGDYFPNGKGLEYYAKVWSTKGVAGSSELDYVPTTCAK